jgi:hypothetical protein
MIFFLKKNLNITGKLDVGAQSPKLEGTIRMEP